MTRTRTRHCRCGPGQAPHCRRLLALARQLCGSAALLLFRRLHRGFELQRYVCGRLYWALLRFLCGNICQGDHPPRTAPRHIAHRTPPPLLHSTPPHPTPHSIHHPIHHPIPPSPIPGPPSLSSETCRCWQLAIGDWQARPTSAARLSRASFRFLLPTSTCVLSTTGLGEYLLQVSRQE